MYVRAFERTGFTGGLNWYRNIDRNWELTAPFAERRIQAPAMFLTGELDLVRQLHAGGGDARLGDGHARERDRPGCRALGAAGGARGRQRALLGFLSELAGPGLEIGARASGAGPWTPGSIRRGRV